MIASVERVSAPAARAVAVIATLLLAVAAFAAPGIYAVPLKALCTVEDSTSSEDEGRSFLLDFGSGKWAEVTWTDRRLPGPMLKVFDDGLTMTLVNVSDTTGTVEVIIVHKQSGRFIRTAAGAVDFRMNKLDSLDEAGLFSRGRCE